MFSLIIFVAFLIIILVVLTSCLGIYLSRKYKFIDNIHCDELLIKKILE